MKEKYTILKKILNSNPDISSNETTISCYENIFYNSSNSSLSEIYKNVEKNRESELLNSPYSIDNYDLNLYKTKQKKNVKNHEIFDENNYFSFKNINDKRNYNYKYINEKYMTKKATVKENFKNRTYNIEDCIRKINNAYMKEAKEQKDKNIYDINERINVNSNKCSLNEDDFSDSLLFRNNFCENNFFQENLHEEDLIQERIKLKYSQMNISNDLLSSNFEYCCVFCSKITLIEKIKKVMFNKIKPLCASCFNIFLNLIRVNSIMCISCFTSFSHDYKNSKCVICSNFNNLFYGNNKEKLDIIRKELRIFRALHKYEFSENLNSNTFLNFFINMNYCFKNLYCYFSTHQTFVISKNYVYAKYTIPFYDLIKNLEKNSKIKLEDDKINNILDEKKEFLKNNYFLNEMNNIGYNLISHNIKEINVNDIGCEKTNGIQNKNDFLKNESNRNNNSKKIFNNDNFFLNDSINSFKKNRYSSGSNFFFDNNNNDKHSYFNLHNGDVEKYGIKELKKKMVSISKMEEREIYNEEIENEKYGKKDEDEYDKEEKENYDNEKEELFNQNMQKKYRAYEEQKGKKKEYEYEEREEEKEEQHKKEYEELEQKRKREYEKEYEEDENEEQGCEEKEEEEQQQDVNEEENEDEEQEYEEEKEEVEEDEEDVNEEENEDEEQEYEEEKEEVEEDEDENEEENEDEEDVNEEENEDEEQEYEEEKGEVEEDENEEQKYGESENEENEDEEEDEEQKYGESENEENEDEEEDEEQEYEEEKGEVEEDEEDENEEQKYGGENEENKDEEEDENEELEYEEEENEDEQEYEEKGENEENENEELEYEREKEDENEEIEYEEEKDENEELEYEKEKEDENEELEYEEEKKDENEEQEYEEEKEDENEEIEYEEEEDENEENEDEEQEEKGGEIKEDGEKYEYEKLEEKEKEKEENEEDENEELEYEEEKKDENEEQEYEEEKENENEELEYEEEKEDEKEKEEKEKYKFEKVKKKEKEEAKEEYENEENIRYDNKEKEEYTYEKEKGKYSVLKEEYKEKYGKEKEYKNEKKEEHIEEKKREDIKQKIKGDERQEEIEQIQPKQKRGNIMEHEETKEKCEEEHQKREKKQNLEKEQIEKTEQIGEREEKEEKEKVKEEIVDEKLEQEIMKVEETEENEKKEKEENVKYVKVFEKIKEKNRDIMKKILNNEEEEKLTNENILSSNNKLQQFFDIFSDTIISSLLKLKNDKIKSSFYQLKNFFIKSNNKINLNKYIKKYHGKSDLISYYIKYMDRQEKETDKLFQNLTVTQKEVEMFKRRFKIYYGSNANQSDINKNIYLKSRLLDRVKLLLENKIKNFDKVQKNEEIYEIIYEFKEFLELSINCNSHERNSLIVNSFLKNKTFENKKYSLRKRTNKFNSFNEKYEKFRSSLTSAKKIMIIIYDTFYKNAHLTNLDSFNILSDIKMFIYDKEIRKINNNLNNHLQYNVTKRMNLLKCKKEYIIPEIVCVLNIKKKNFDNFLIKNERMKIINANTLSYLKELYFFDSIYINNIYFNEFMPNIVSKYINHFVNQNNTVMFNFSINYLKNKKISFFNLFHDYFNFDKTKIKNEDVKIYDSSILLKKSIEFTKRNIKKYIKQNGTMKKSNKPIINSFKKNISYNNNFETSNNKQGYKNEMLFIKIINELKNKLNEIYNDNYNLTLNIYSQKKKQLYNISRCIFKNNTNKYEDDIKKDKIKINFSNDSNNKYHKLNKKLIKGEEKGKCIHNYVDSCNSTYNDSLYLYSIDLKRINNINHYINNHNISKFKKSSIIFLIKLELSLPEDTNKQKGEKKKIFHFTLVDINVPIFDIMKRNSVNYLAEFKNMRNFENIFINYIQSYFFNTSITLYSDNILKFLFQKDPYICFILYINDDFIFDHNFKNTIINEKEMNNQMKNEKDKRYIILHLLYIYYWCNICECFNLTKVIN
ncbi:conserved Plasmodium protein, unknown function [Plasmodium relictum]|uniref:Uncharacterized protein n=1 Tax=Plasmodium relictum TaxID=85471 RepID=A0A1J1HDH6_PLARL|nr:conserved Plasmodium protein, unknown function [Plasmodium relictum]CRH03830.1 conserved Plasmodium protein, unknown function [Plasmodium relictum]